MLKRSVILAAAVALGAAGTASAQVEVKKNNDNVTKVEATSEDLRVKGMTNPAQTRVKGRASDGSKVDVRIKPPKN